ncbi:MAG: translation initiation factor translation initiation factor [Candidatus Parcubacteria bacterium]
MARHPVVVVMGHIDHGKSTLLDYIRKTNVVAKEAGGITQHLSAYVVLHETKESGVKPITFLDTPGHAAFQKMRLRGADVADVAILVVSAEEGVKPQTLEALASIKQANIPYVVAINKIDKPNANIERTKISLIENEIYIEGMGGDISYAPISAKAGTGVDDLLDLVLLTADLAGLEGDEGAPATGVVIESELESKRGTSATLIVKNGTLKSGTFVVSGTAFAPVRIMEDFRGKPIKEAGLSVPVCIVGFTDVPVVGSSFSTCATKKEAEALVFAAKNNPATTTATAVSTLPAIPVVIKADTVGSLEGIEHEIAKIPQDRVFIKIVDKTVGSITENDVKNVGTSKNAIILGFNAQVDRQAKDMAERLGVEIATFDIIYKLAEWLTDAVILRTPKETIDVKTGDAKILKEFSVQRHTHVLGGRVQNGVLKVGEVVKVLRRDLEIGRGKIDNLQQQKANVKEVSQGEFGMELDTKAEIMPGDTIEAFETVER